MILSLGNNKSIFVTLQEKDIEECRSISVVREKFHLWGDKASFENKRYRKGILNTKKDPRRTERIGLYGEKVFSLLTGFPLDQSKREEGDPGWDFIIDNLKIDIKTASWENLNFTKIYKPKYYGEHYLKATDDYGNLLTLRSDVYFICSLIYHNGEKVVIVNGKKYRSEIDATKVIIEIKGFILKEEILKNKEQRLADKLVKDEKAKWKNYYIKNEELISPLEFLWEHRNSLNSSKISIFV